MREVPTLGPMRTGDIPETWKGPTTGMLPWTGRLLAQAALPLLPQMVAMMRGVEVDGTLVTPVEVSWGAEGSSGSGQRAQGCRGGGGRGHPLQWAKGTGLREAEGTGLQGGGALAVAASGAGQGCPTPVGSQQRVLMCIWSMQVSTLEESVRLRVVVAEGRKHEVSSRKNTGACSSIAPLHCTQRQGPGSVAGAPS
jgi:hypothetical protein